MPTHDPCDPSDRGLVMDLPNCVALDFETYYKDVKGDTDKYSLKQMSIPEYVHDAQFKLHGVALCDGTDSWFWAGDIQAVCQTVVRRADAVIMHNAMFDDYILRNVLDIHPRKVIDTLQLARYIHGAKRETGASLSLGALAKRYGLEAKGDLGFANGKRDLTEAETQQLAEYARTDVRITYQLAMLMLPKIRPRDFELWVADHTTRLFTDPNRGIMVDIPGLRELRENAQASFAEAYEGIGVDVSKNKAFTEALRVALARTGRKLPMRAGKRGPTPATSKKDKEMQAFLEDSDPTVRALCNARVGKKSEDQLVARLRTMERTAELLNGRVPVSFDYCGAGTGRWTGSGGLNFQNMGRDPDSWQGKIRGLIRPRKGHLFVIADASQIEARITAWYAGQQDMLDVFASGGDIYSAFAGEIFQTFEVDKGGPERFIGKTAVLGLGFGMGSHRFYTDMEAKPEGQEAIKAGILDPMKARGIVRLYRDKYCLIPMLWKRLEQDLKDMLAGIDIHGSFRYEWDGGTLCTILPSGRPIRYVDLRLIESREKKLDIIDKSGKIRQHTMTGDALVYGSGNEWDLYGGKIVENVVQGTARDIFARAMKRLEDLGQRVLFHVHDEVILEVEEVHADVVKDMVLEALSDPPSWAAGLPLAAEVTVADRYGK